MSLSLGNTANFSTFRAPFKTNAFLWMTVILKLQRLAFLQRIENMVKLILEQFCMCLCLVEVAVINVTTLDWQHSKFLPVLWRSQIQTVEMSKMCQRGSTPC